MEKQDKKMENRRKHYQPSGGPSLVQRHYADAADLNKIMERARRTGAPIQGPGVPGNREPRFLHVTGQSFHEMLTQVQQVQGAFAGLPAKVRKRFSNNPMLLLDFVSDPKNAAEAVELGILEPDSETARRVIQEDLARQADENDFREWQKSKRQNLPADEDANSMPGKADPESQPHFSKKKRTS